MTRAVHRAGFRPLLFASRQLLLRPAALKIAAFMLLMLLALGLYSLSRGSFPLPASTLARALLAPQELATGAMTALVGAPLFIFIAARFFK